jgi:TNF receptor-associated factor 2
MIEYNQDRVLFTFSQDKIPDKYFQRKVNNLHVACIACSEWTGTLADYKQHYQKSHSFDETPATAIDPARSSNMTMSSVNSSPTSKCMFERIGCSRCTQNKNENVSHHLTLHLDYCMSKFKALEDKLDRLSLIDNSPQAIDSKSSSSHDLKIQQLSSKLDALQSIQAGLIADMSRVMASNEKLKNEKKALAESLLTCKNTTQELHKVLALTQVSLLSIEERIINQEKASYDGTLLWKINNIQERMQEAKSGRQTSFYSPPFYTSRANGYKMCSRIYLNGDGNGRNTHLSLFFVILRGENDALLRWPFRQKVTNHKFILFFVFFFLLMGPQIISLFTKKVTFVLIDQSFSESKENIYDAFRPDPNSSSFRRPVSDMNIASGLPLFCPLGKLMSSDHEYIKDNTLFIKIIVDTKDLTEI